MRIYEDCTTMIEETYRELWKRSQTIRDATIQGKVITSKDYEQKELIFYNYRVDNFDDLNAMLKKAKEVSGKEHITMETAKAWLHDMLYNSSLKEKWWELYPSTSKYFKKFCVENKKGEAAYSYGERMISQIPHVIKRMKGNRYCRGAQIVLTREKDAKNIGHRQPCTVSYHFITRPTLTGDKMNLIITQRSADVMNFFPLDFAKGVLLLKHIAKKVGVDVGYIVHSVNSLHAYAIDCKDKYKW